jgi:hypothetical protein
MANMDWDDYLRDKARMYRQLAKQAKNDSDRQDHFESAAICDEVANSIEDRLTGG